MNKTGGCLLLVLLLAGCSSLPGGKQVHNYDTLPGSSPTMSDKAGLFSGSQKDNYDGGTLVYSTDKSKKSLVHTPNQDESQQSAGEMHNSGAAATAAPASSSASTSARSSQVQTQARRSDYDQFEQYQQFKKFKQSAPSSSERQKFREWQDWKQYQQWRKNGGGQ